MTNREKLEGAKIIKKTETFTPAQEKAIESLTDEEVKALISVKDKLKPDFPVNTTGLPVQHH